MRRPRILRMRPNYEIFAPENFWIFSKIFEFRKNLVRNFFFFSRENWGIGVLKRAVLLDLKKTYWIQKICRFLNACQEGLKRAPMGVEDRAGVRCVFIKCIENHL